jgi:hypothetical protein
MRGRFQTLQGATLLRAGKVSNRLLSGPLSILIVNSAPENLFRIDLEEGVCYFYLLDLFLFFFGEEDSRRGHLDFFYAIYKVYTSGRCLDSYALWVKILTTIRPSPYLRYQSSIKDHLGC